MTVDKKAATGGRLFLCFMKIGLLSVGGGMTMLPMMEAEIAEKRGWLPKQEIFDYFALAQALPGLIAPNTAALIGRKLAGRVGAASAVAGVILPSFLIIMLIALFFRQIAENNVVQSIFTGLQIALVALFASVLWRLGKQALIDIVTIALFVFVFVLYLWLDLNPVWFVLFGVALGLLLGGRRHRRT